MATERLGRDVLLKYDSANVGGASATWVSIPFQTDRSMDGTTSTTDGSTVSDVGWKRDVATGAGWNLSGTMFLDPADTVHAALYAKWKAKATAWIQLDRSAIGGLKEEGQAFITKWGEKYSKEGLVSVDVEFSMQGAPVTSAV